MYRQSYLLRLWKFLLLGLGLFVLATGGVVLAGAPKGLPANNPPDPAPSSSQDHLAPRSPVPGPDGQGYYVQVVLYAWIEIAVSGTLLLVSNWISISNTEPLDDGYAVPFQIGFRFPFHKVIYSRQGKLRDRCLGEICIPAGERIVHILSSV